MNAGYCLCLMMLPLVLAAQDAADTTVLRDKYLSLKRRLKTIEQKHAEEIRRDKAYRKRMAGVIDKREQELQNAAAAFDRIESDLETVRNRTAVRQRKIQNLEKRRHRIREIIVSAARKLKQQIENEFPAMADKRSESVELLMRDITANDITAEEAFNRFWVILDNERRFSRSIDVRTRDLTLPSGVTTVVSELRVGTQLLMYVSSDNNHYGILKPGQKDGKRIYTWQTEDVDFAVRSAIRNAVAVKTGKEPPQLVDLPVYVEAVEGGGQ